VTPDERNRRNDLIATWAVLGLCAVGMLVWGYALPDAVGLQELWQP
jgi:hypothetical protein